MKIDEAIKEEQTLYDIAKDKYEKLGIKNCVKRMEEHKQYIEWLEELKTLREEKSEFLILAKDIAKGNYEMGMKSGYNKAVDDFERIMCEELKDYIDNKDYMCVGLSLHKFTRDLAEQLKAGVENENF